MSQHTSSSSLARPSERIADWRDDHDCPGLSVAIVDRDETVLETAVGERCRDTGAPATPATRYGVGSAAKPVTATAVLALASRGTIALSDPIADFVPGFADAPGTPITIRELLTHTSGLPADSLEMFILGEALFDADLGPSVTDWEGFDAFVANHVDDRLTDRERFMYYNSGYVALGRLLERVTDATFPAAVRELVLDPLDMSTATFDTTVLADTDADVMTPYRRNEEGLTAATLPANPLFAPPGGLVASVQDLAAFLTAHIIGEVPIGNELRTAMYDQQTVAGERIDGVTEGYGYGWEIRPFADDTLVGHSGNTGVSAGYVGFLRERGLGVAIGCNTPPATSPEALAVDLLCTLTDTDPTTVRPERALATKAALASGTYESAQGIHEITVERDEACLHLEHDTPLGGDSQRLAPVSIDPADLTFEAVEADGDRLTAEFLGADPVTEAPADTVVVHGVRAKRVGTGPETDEDANSDRQD